MSRSSSSNTASSASRSSGLATPSANATSDVAAASASTRSSLTSTSSSVASSPSAWDLRSLNFALTQLSGMYPSSTSVARDALRCYLPRTTAR